MATHFFSRSLPKTLTKASLLSRSLSIATSAASLSNFSSRSSLPLFHRLRPLAGVIFSAVRLSPSAVRSLATNSTTSSLRDPNPNWSNRPPKETILLDGCDFEHWLVVMEPPQGEPTRDEIIDSYIKTLASVLGSEEQARMKIYSVSTRCYYAFGALVDEETSLKLKEIPNVRWVLPDSYLDVKNKDYGGEPFINGQAVPYDPKYHEEWIRNNSRANERNRRNDRPRNFDRSRNFERRRENMQNRDVQNRPPMNQAGPNPGPSMPAPNSGPNMPGPNSGPNMPGPFPGPNMPGPNSGPNMPGPFPGPNMPGPNPAPNMPGPNFGPNMPGPGNNMGPPPPSNMGPPPPSNMGPPTPRNMGPVPPTSANPNNPNNMQQGNNWNGGQPNNWNGGQPNNNWSGGQPNNNWNGGQPNNNWNGGQPNNWNGSQPNMGGGQANNMGGGQPNAGRSGPGQFQSNYTPDRDNGGIPGTNRY